MPETKDNTSSITLRELNRAVLARQMLLRREQMGVVEAVEQLAGMQAQYSPSPYIGLWTRIEGFKHDDFTAALHDRRIVKGSLMRWTLHVASARDFPYFTTAMGAALVGMVRSEAEKIGIDVAELHRVALEYTAEPRLVDDIVAYMNEALAGVDKRHERVGWRWAQAPGWLVHVPPSGTWRYFGKNAYVSAHTWLERPTVPSVEEAVVYLVRSYLRAFGPATRTDILQWSGLRTVGQVDVALKSLEGEITILKDEAGKVLYDFEDGPRPGGDTEAPVRYLPKWDNLLLAYDKRERVLPDRYRKTVIRVNGDVLPTILVDGMVAGVWSTKVERKVAVLTIEPFEPLGPETIRQLEEEGEALVRFVEPDATGYSTRIIG